MKKGQLIRVRAYRNKELDRVLLEEHESYVAVCRPELYHQFENSAELAASFRDLPVMGFPKEDVIEDELPQFIGR